MNQREARRRAKWLAAKLLRAVRRCIARPAATAPASKPPPSAPIASKPRRTVRECWADSGARVPWPAWCALLDLLEEHGVKLEALQEIEPEHIDQALEARRRR